MKKFLSLILALTLVVSLFTVNVMAAKDHSVTIDTETKTGLKAGDTVVVTVVLDSTDNVQALGYALLYDTNAFSVDKTQAWMSMKDFAMHENCIDQTWYDEMKGSPLGSILNPSVNALTDGAIKFAGAGSMGIPAAVAATNYTLGKFTFTVKADAADGKYEFKLDDSVGESYSKEPGDNAGTLVTGNVLTVTVGEEKQEATPSVNTEFGTATAAGIAANRDGEAFIYDNAYAVTVKMTNAKGATKAGIQFIPAKVLEANDDIWDDAAEVVFTTGLGEGEDEYTAALINIPRKFAGQTIKMFARGFMVVDGTPSYGKTVEKDIKYTITAEPGQN